MVINCTNCTKEINLGSSMIRHITSAEGDKYFCNDGCKVKWQTTQTDTHICAYCKTLLGSTYIRNIRMAVFFCDITCKDRYISALPPNEHFLQKELDTCSELVNSTVKYVTCRWCQREIAPAENKTLLTFPDRLPMVFCCPEHRDEFLTALPVKEPCYICSSAMPVNNYVRLDVPRRVLYFCNVDHYNEWLAHPCHSTGYSDKWCDYLPTTGGFMGHTCVARAKMKQTVATARRMTDTPLDGSHYRRGGMEAYDIMDAWQLDHYLSDALQYLLRADHKGTKVADIHKAINVLIRAKEVYEKEEKK